MVYLKVTDGVETRKFEVTPGELTYDQLKEQLGDKFPNIGKDLSFVYRDTDGDIITLSSDAELQSVLTQLPADGVWKLKIKGSKQPPQNRHNHAAHQHRHTQGVSLFDSLFDHLRTPSLRHNFDAQLRETEELLQQARSGACCGGPATTEEKPTTEATEAKPNTESTAPKAEGENDTTPKASGPEDEVKSKKTEKEAVAKTEPEWQWVVRSWQPRYVFTPFGLSTVLRPTTYRVYWSQSSEEKGEGNKAEKPSEGAPTTVDGPAETTATEPSSTPVSEPQTSGVTAEPQDTEQ